MTNTRRIEVASLRSDSGLRAAVESRQANRPKARDMVARMFGEDVLEGMLRVGGHVPDGRPTLVLSRQLAKPDMQYASMYLAAKRLGYSMLTLEWTDDKMCVDTGSYKRTYVKLPLGGIGRNGSLFTRGVEMIDPKLTMGVTGRRKIRELSVPGSSISQLREITATMTPGFMNGEMGDGDLGLPEFHKGLRAAMGIDDLPATDLMGEIGIMATVNLLRSGKLGVPGLGESRVTIGGDGRAAETKVSGQLMNVLVFTMQNLLPNLVLAVTDWNGDDQIIQDRYLAAVEFLESNGLRPPLQTFIPSMNNSLGEKVSGTQMELDNIIPLTNRIGELSGTRPTTEDIGENIIEAGKSILKLMRDERSTRLVQ